MEHPDENQNASEPQDGLDRQLSELAIRNIETPRKKKPSLRPSDNLTIHPTPYTTLQSPIYSHHALAATPNNERSYLLENRQRQHDRGKRLSDALQIIEVRISSMQSKGEVRKLRREAGLLKKKIAESHRQEQLIMLRLHDIQTEELNQASYWQPQPEGLMPYAASPWLSYSPMTPWTPMTLPVMLPVYGPVSPLTPLPPGLYHPSPIVPSPLTSPYWLGAHHQFQYQYQPTPPYFQTDPAYYAPADFQQPYVPDEVAAREPSQRRSTAPTVARLVETKHKAYKSVDFELGQEGAYRGRRWSLANSFSPTPKDKRMSIPGLETIWKDNKEKEEEVSAKDCDDLRRDVVRTE